MGRLLVACVLGCGLFALAAWQFGLLDSGETRPTSGTQTRIALPSLSLGGDLYPAKAFPPAPHAVPERRVDPVVAQGNLAVVDSSDLPAEIAGQLIFIGDEVPEGALQAAGVAAFLVEPFDFTAINQGTYPSIKPFRRLKVGDFIYENQLLGMVNPAKALGDIKMKNAQLTAAEMDAEGAKAIAKEAQFKFETSTGLLSRRALASEEFRSAMLTRDKMTYDSFMKIAAYDKAVTEEKMSEIIYKQHEVRNRNAGKRSIIQKLYKKQGDGVKDLEPVMQVYSLEKLTAEAQIDDTYRARLGDKPIPVTIEPTLVDSPPKTYRSHVAAVNCLAVTHDAKSPLIISGAEDKTVCVWDRYQSQPLHEWKHPDAVKALACTPVGAPGNFVLTGCADGSIRLYNLKQPKEEPKTAKEHSIAVTALAFSPDGKFFASGGADGSIFIWKTENLEPVYPFNEAHGITDTPHGNVTALSFTPQGKLVAASGDNNIYVWSLKENGASPDFMLPFRSGSVGQIGVTADGKWLLFDQGKTLQIRSLQNQGRVVNTLQNPGGAIPFDTVALFSPDASLLLTAGASEGRLQLWKAPTESGRGFEVRQFATEQRSSPVSCAAFAPLPDYNGEGTFAVSANKDGQIYLWPLPSQKEVDNHQIKNLTLRIRDAGLNVSTRINVTVDVPNPASDQFPKGRFEPGRPVTIVIE